MSKHEKNKFKQFWTNFDKVHLEKVMEARKVSKPRFILGFRVDEDRFKKFDKILNESKLNATEIKTIMLDEFLKNYGS